VPSGTIRPEHPLQRCESSIELDEDVTACVPTVVELPSPSESCQSAM
jgi:hypothetical protein